MIIQEKKERAKKVKTTEVLLGLTNLSSFALLWKQNLSMVNLLHDHELMKKKIASIEKLSEKPEKVPVVVLNNGGEVLEPNLFKWILIILVVAISAYLAYILYVKWIGLSFLSFLPNVNLPFDLIPYLKKVSSFECILGDYTLRIKTVGKNIEFIEAKHINELIYKPLQDILVKDNGAGKAIVSEAAKALVETGKSIDIASPLFSDPSVAVNTSLAVDGVQAVLNSI